MSSIIDTQHIDDHIQVTSDVISNNTSVVLDNETGQQQQDSLVKSDDHSEQQHLEVDLTNTHHSNENPVESTDQQQQQEQAVAAADGSNYFFAAATTAAANAAADVTATGTPSTANSGYPYYYPTGTEGNSLEAAATAAAIAASAYMPNLSNPRRSRVSALEISPYFKPTKQIPSIYSMDRTRQYTVRLLPRLDKGFFFAENDWTCYRRNYFQLTCSFTCTDNTGLKVELPCLIDYEGSLKTVNEFHICLTAKSSNAGRDVELIQHTAKRDKGPSTFPSVKRCDPQDLTPAYGMRPEAEIFHSVTFERIQFKTATANNGKRRAAQQYHYLYVELFAKCDDDTTISVANTESAPLVVRGRAPGHYHSMQAKEANESMEGLNNQFYYHPAAAAAIAATTGNAAAAAAAAANGQSTPAPGGAPAAGTDAAAAAAAAANYYPSMMQSGYYYHPYYWALSNQVSAAAAAAAAANGTQDSNAAVTNADEGTNNNETVTETVAVVQEEDDEEMIDQGESANMTEATATGTPENELVDEVGLDTTGVLAEKKRALEEAAAGVVHDDEITKKRRGRPKKAST